MIAYFARHPTAANLLMISIILLGVAGSMSIRRDVFPEFSSDYVNVQMIYRGASAEEVEETICQRIEEEIEGIEGIAQIESIAREGVAFVTIEVADGYEVRSVLKDVENAVDTIDNFPVNAEDPVVWEVKQISPVCTVSVWAENTPEKDLLAFGDTVKEELQALEAVSQVATVGFSDHQIRVEVRQQALLSHGLTIDDVAREIEAQSLDLPAGSVETGQREIKIRLVDQRRRAEDFRDLIVKASATGARVPLRNVATVTDTFEDEWMQTTFNGRRSVNLEVSKTDQEDTILVADEVKAYVERRRETLPPGVNLTLWGDYSFYVKDRLGMLRNNGILGSVLVFLTLWLLLNIRLSFWVAVGIPISFLGTIWLMQQTDMTLNMITMFALIMAVGIIVDDAIVIGENIYAHYSRGKDAAQAAIDGTREVSLGVLASMLTTVAIFMPLLAMEGEIGKVMRVMPMGVITALAVSLIEAFFVLPNHLAHSLAKIPQQAGRVRAAIDRFVEWFTQRVYGRVLDWSVKRPLVPVAGVVAMFLISLGMLTSGRLKFELFPELDGDFLVAQVELPQGTDLSRTQEIVRRIEDGLDVVNERFRPRQPEGQDLVRHVGTAFGFSKELEGGPIPPETGRHLAQVIVELLYADVRDARCDEILELWRTEVGPVADVVNLTFKQMDITPGGKPIDIQLRGRELDDLKRASLALQDKVRTYPGVLNLNDNLRPGKEEVKVRVKPSARPLGVTSAALAMQLRGAFWGSIAEEFQRGPDTFEVEVQFAPDDRRSLADLHDFKVQTPTGQTRPLHEVATYEKVRGFSQIVRVDRRRTISITADLDKSKGNSAEIVEELERDYFPLFAKEHPGVTISLEGQRKESAKTTGSLKRGFLIGLAMIFLMLCFIFQSYTEPLIVMAAIPFGLIGAVTGHILLGHNWTMPSTIGFISLAGIVVNDSIVLVSFVKLRLREGKAVLDAVHQAGMDRFRPVFLTSATTVAGLMPMMLETSLQAQFLIPMAVSIAFGLMFATVVVLVLVPSLYSILARLGWAQRIQVDHSGTDFGSGGLLGP